MTFHPLGEIIKDDLGAEAHRLLRSKCDMGGLQGRLGACRMGEAVSSGGSLSKTSMAAPAITPFSSAEARSFSTTTGPRATLTRKSRGLHHRKLFCVDHATGRVVQRAMQNHDVRAVEQFFLRDLLDVFCNAVMVRTALRQNSSTKCVKQLGSPGADLAKTDNTDRFALDLPADKTGLVLSFTAAVFHTAEIPGKRKSCADDQLGNCLVGVTGSIADGDILLLGSIQTNMIHTGKSNINKLELVTLAQDIGRHRHIGKDHGVCILGFFDQFGGIGGFGIIHKHMPCASNGALRAASSSAEMPRDSIITILLMKMPSIIGK